jgi:hypothetical protein
MHGRRPNRDSAQHTLDGEGFPAMASRQDPEHEHRQKRRPLLKLAILVGGRTQARIDLAVSLRMCPSTIVGTIDASE